MRNVPNLNHFMNKFDVIVIGAGHSGIEAASAAANMGLNTLILTLKADTVGAMSCNPAIGGIGKGQLVKEIDALGGQMAKAADICGIQFRVLNASKGAAVHSSRAQIDMYEYNRYMCDLVKKSANLSVMEAQVKELILENNTIKGVITGKKEEIAAKTVVICAGTFLDGLIHIGLKHFSGGRINECSAVGLGEQLSRLGFNILRFKTGTCPRLDKNTIDFSKLIVQNGDNPPRPFSFSTKKITQTQVPCYITYTNPKSHNIIRANLDRSPLYAGVIKATGVRYCPSIEDKIVKFADKERHQVFLEPQGRNSDEIYPNGISTSLPEDVQLELIHSIEGLENARVIRFGYGIEYSVVDSTQLYPTLESKLIRNLYIAGQLNGTTGYEEAAGQGLVAGINAGLRIKKQEPLILDRASGYIGVLIDDLTTKGTNEPYRLFTSRVEYRLILREDNADLRLSKIGYELGLVTKKEYEYTLHKIKGISEGVKLLQNTRVKPSKEVNAMLEKNKTPPLRKSATLEELLKRPQVTLEDIKSLKEVKVNILDSASLQVEIEVKYRGFVQRQLKDVERFENLEKIKIPAVIDYSNINGLSREIREKLNKFKPLNLGQASRISGVTPAAITLLMVYLRKLNG